MGRKLYLPIRFLLVFLDSNVRRLETQRHRSPGEIPGDLMKNILLRSSQQLHLPLVQVASSLAPYSSCGAKPSKRKPGTGHCPAGRSVPTTSNCRDWAHQAERKPTFHRPKP